MRPAPCYPKRPHSLLELYAFTETSFYLRVILSENRFPLFGITRYASSGTAWPLMRCLRIADGLNTITRRGEIGTSLPVLGFRPIRWPFLRTTNEPNEDNFTVSPRSRQSVISLSTNSTSEADSVRERPTFW